MKCCPPKLKADSENESVQIEHASHKSQWDYVKIISMKRLLTSALCFLCFHGGEIFHFLSASEQKTNFKIIIGAIFKTKNANI